MSVGGSPGTSTTSTGPIGPSRAAAPCSRYPDPLPILSRSRISMSAAGTGTHYAQVITRIHTDSTDPLTREGR
jgi:hypothetical protein